MTTANGKHNVLFTSDGTTITERDFDGLPDAIEFIEKIVAANPSVFENVRQCGQNEWKAVFNMGADVTVFKIKLTRAIGNSWVAINGLTKHKGA